MGISAPYISKEEIRQKANAFLCEYNPDGETPVDIEKIVEYRFQMDIVPIPGLQESHDVVAYLTNDLAEIRVDNYVYKHRENRYRFSLAHELAHKVLHEQVWDRLRFDSIQKYQESLQAIPEKDYRFLEYHANVFAGLVLVPPSKLAVLFKECVSLAQQNGIDILDEATGGREYVESFLGRDHFNVSAEVIHRRVEADGLWQNQ